MKYQVIYSVGTSNKKITEIIESPEKMQDIHYHKNIQMSLLLSLVVKKYK